MHTLLPLLPLLVAGEPTDAGAGAGKHGGHHHAGHQRSTADVDHSEAGARPRAGNIAAVVAQAASTAIAEGSDVTLASGRMAYAAKFTNYAAGIDRRLVRHLQHFASPSLDIYQFGVFTGTGLKKIAANVPWYGQIFGFDSFQGLPAESAEETQSWRAKSGQFKDHFKQGGYSAAHALGTTSLKAVVEGVAAHIGPHLMRNVSLIPGFFNESLTDELPRSRSMQPALYVDMDADLYLSAIQALDWMFRHGLIVPGTFLRYDDWPRLNATFGPSKGSNFFGQCRAHYELSVKYDVEWKLVAKNSLQVTSLGGVTCGARCDAATPMRKVLVDPGGNYSLLPMWGLPSQREGLS